MVVKDEFNLKGPHPTEKEDVRASSRSDKVAAYTKSARMNPSFSKREIRYIAVFFKPEGFFGTGGKRVEREGGKDRKKRRR